jgi:hypothetical protein
MYLSRVGWWSCVRSIRCRVGDVIVLLWLVCCVVVLVVLLFVLLLWVRGLCSISAGWLPFILVLWYCVPSLLCSLMVLGWCLRASVLWRGGVVVRGLQLVGVIRLLARSRRGFSWKGVLQVFWVRTKKCM